ncbi:MAG: 50S ribosomal protein L18 [Chlamydiota bacterium]
MQNKTIKLNNLRKKRAMRVRKKVRGNSECPRLSVVKSNAHIYAQLIDDTQGHTLASVGTLDKEFKSTDFNKKNKVSAKALGTRIAEKAKDLKIQKVNFDRGQFKYHGVLAELADAARAAGLKF